MSRHKHRTVMRARASHRQLVWSPPRSHEANWMASEQSSRKVNRFHHVGLVIIAVLIGDFAIAQHPVRGQDGPSTTSSDRQDALQGLDCRPLAKESVNELTGEAKRVDRRPRLFRAKLVSNLILVPNVDDEPYPGEATETELLPPATNTTAEFDVHNAAPDRLRTFRFAETSVHPVQSATPVHASETPKQWLDVRPRTIEDDQLSTNIVPPAELPADASHLPPMPQIPELIQLYSFNLHRVDFCDSATFCHRPLYFEDRSLERCGISRGIFRCAPPVQSGVHFLSRAALLPASMLHERPCNCVRSECICR